MCGNGGGKLNVLWCPWVGESAQDSQTHSVLSLQTYPFQLRNFFSAVLLKKKMCRKAPEMILGLLAGCLGMDPGYTTGAR